MLMPKRTKYRKVQKGRRCLRFIHAGIQKRRIDDLAKLEVSRPAGLEARDNGKRLGVPDGKIAVAACDLQKHLPPWPLRPLDIEGGHHRVGDFFQKTLARFEVVQDGHAIDAHDAGKLAYREILLPFFGEHLQRRIHQILAADTPAAPAAFLVFVLQR